MTPGLVLASVEEFNAVISPDEESTELDPLPVKVRTSTAGVSIFGPTPSGSNPLNQRQDSGMFTGVHVGDYYTHFGWLYSDSLVALC